MQKWHNPKLFLKNPALSLSSNLGYFELENEDSFKKKFLNLDVNLDYTILPYDNFSPYIYGGIGSITNNRDLKDMLLKFQYGLGIEYLPSNKFGLYLFGEQNLMFNDKIDDVVQGKRNDYYWKIGAGINFYFGKPYNRAKKVLFE